MHYTERKAKERLEQEGWRVLRPGWPDFLCVRGKEIKMVEVKTVKTLGGKDRLSAAQKATFWELLKAGFRLETLYVEED